MKSKGILVSLASAVFLLSTSVASAASLSTSCVGVPSTSSITWTASSADGVAPVAFLWQNGSTTPVLTTPVSPGTFSMTIQATDASSTVATSTCSATVVAPSGSPDTALQAQIKSIMSQIAALNAQLKLLLQQQQQQNGGIASSTCPVFSRNLSVGDDGDDVRALQSSLSADPTILSPGLVTGHFGPHTKDALLKFQHKFGIASTSTGFFGPMTRNFFGKKCGHEGNDNRGGTSSSSPSVGIVGGRGEGRGNDR